MRVFKIMLAAILLLTAGLNAAPAADVDSGLKLDVKSFQLDNGMLFLVVERHAAPQIAARVAIRAGSALEAAGKTGIAHLLEHMMFKGTQNFGTTDRRQDKILQDRIESAYQTVLTEKQKRNPDPAVIEKNLADMAGLRRQVQNIYVPQAFSAQLGKNGAVGVNAFTTKDQTQYIMSVPADMLEQWFSIVSEQLFEPSWREFYVEKEIVQREWAFRYINNPNGAAWLDLDAAAYRAHPYRNPVIGWKSDMENFSTRDAIAFHRKYYNPTNAVCVLVGDIDPQEARRLAEIYFARYPAAEKAPEKVTAEPEQQGPRTSVRYLKGARTPLVRIGFHAAPMGARDFYAIDALTMILSQGRSARMTQHLVDTGLAAEAWAYNPDNRYGGMIVLGGSPVESPEYAGYTAEEKRRAYLKDCQEIETRLLAEIEKMKTEPVTKRELERIKKLNQREFLDRLRSNEALAGTLASLEVQAGWQYLTTYLENISAVTPEDILRVAGTYVRDDNRTSIYILPGGAPDHPPESYSEVRTLESSAAVNLKAPEDLSNHSRYSTPAGWKHPLSFERHPAKIDYPQADRLSVDGATVFFLPDTELPLIDLSLQIKAGRVDVSDQKRGLGQLLEDTLVRGGTETHSPSELARVLDENAIRLSVSVREEATSINLSVMKSDWIKGLALLQDVLTRPGFDDRVIAVMKKQALTALARHGEDAQAVSMREAMIWHFKGHPYGRDPLAALQTIPSLTRQDLKQFMSTYFVPANMVVAVSGDISGKEVQTGLERLFAQFPHQAPPRRILADPPRTPPMITLIHKPGQVQSQISLTLRGIQRTDPDYWDLSLLTQIFGGSDSLLYTRLRDDLGLVYSAGFYQTSKWQAGLMIGYIGCKGDQTRESIAETLGIMQALQKEVPESLFDLKRLDALNSFVFNVDTPFALVNAYSRYFMRNEPLNTLDRIQNAFLNASREKLKILAGRLLDPKQIQIVVVADKTTRIRRTNHIDITLENDLMALAKAWGLPYREIALR